MTGTQAAFTFALRKPSHSADLADGVRYLVVRCISSPAFVCSADTAGLGLIIGHRANVVSAAPTLAPRSLFCWKVLTGRCAGGAHPRRCRKPLPPWMFLRMILYSG